MQKEIQKYPYNATIEDEIKIFLSDQICEQVVRITCRNVQILCTIRNKMTNKKTEIAVSAALIFGASFGMPKQVQAIGVSPIVTSAPEIHRPAPQHFRQYAPTVNLRLDKICLVANNKMIPLIYINPRYSSYYINERLLKKLRGGNLTVVAIGVVVCIMAYLSGGVDSSFILPPQNPGW
jgi:hypothetical protein